MKKYKRILAGGVLSAALVIGGAAAYTGGESTVEASQLSSAPTSTSTSTTSKMITVQQAKEAALKEVQGTIDDIDLEKENGKVYYEVEIESAKADATVLIDAYTGKVLTVNQDLDFEVTASDADVKISLEKATQIALKELDNSKVISTELDLDDGRYEYEIELVNNKYETDVTIDANTGDVLSVDTDIRDND
ncbi:PepSY domain-containing protein [Paenibacillus gallinarum]|uniref:PepSY domain-containing protein n=1 Tax=Paenibacillus gallinarum TaxID=2762232 RepID=A0ABR8T2L7_9BACL|nr:PepSY domain-containing protein [Paenibacillus gallinarum]MBD7970001.1 PepSY domain-containing protein [Paenibacillus gallinarum]